MSVAWVKIASWHLADTRSASADGVYTLCGRKTSNPIEAERISSERTCESCLRRQVAHDTLKENDGPAPN